MTHQAYLRGPPQIRAWKVSRVVTGSPWEVMCPEPAGTAALLTSPHAPLPSCCSSVNPCTVDQRLSNGFPEI